MGEGKEERLGSSGHSQFEFRKLKSPNSEETLSNKKILLQGGEEKSRGFIEGKMGRKGRGGRPKIKYAYL